MISDGAISNLNVIHLPPGSVVGSVNVCLW